MTLQEYLLICFNEELSEVQQEISKCLRFTLDHFYEPYGNTNLDRVQLEMADVYAVSQLLENIGIKTGLVIPEKMSPDMAARFIEKKIRTLNLAKVSNSMGALVDPDFGFYKVVVNDNTTTS